MSAVEPAVSVTALSRHYGQVEALSDVSVSLAPGRFLVLLGPSGSGKSTLIRCLAGIERPTSGEITIAGRVVADRRTLVQPEKRDLAMVFQDFALWPHMTAIQNVMFALRRRRITKSDAVTRSRGMLARVGLQQHGERYPHELSGGEQQRVALARALVAQPALLLFDEPLSSLDANLRERLRIEIGTLVREQGGTAVYITHDQSEAFALGDEIGVLEGGRLVQHGTPEDIYRTPATPFVARFTGLAGALYGRLIGSAQERSRSGDELVRLALPTSEATRFVDLLARPAATLAPGAAVQVLLRPTAIRICNERARAAVLRAVVRDGAYHGRGYDYVLELGDGLELTGIFDRRHHPRGATVGIYVDPERALAFPADASVNAPPLAAAAIPGDRAAAAPAQLNRAAITDSLEI